MMTRVRKRLAGWFLPPVIAVVVSILTLALLEGFSSMSLLGYDLVFRPGAGLPSRVHMQPDSLVGWMNIPNTHLPDMFGRNVGLRINAQSFRAGQNFDSIVPPGKVRILCSGDSFTLGVGVDDDDTWCAALERRDPRFQTVNLGHSGWGLDQSYLFYQRNGRKLDHDIHILAFVADDFRRMRLARFVGYPKPLFRLRNDQLTLTGVPVPKPSRFGLWYTYNSDKLNELRVAEFGRRLSTRMGKRQSDGTVVKGKEGQQIMLRLFEDLHRTGQRDGKTTVFVLLEENRKATEQEAGMRDLLAAELGKRGIPFIDLWSEFHQLPASQLEAMFTPKWLHYSAAANELVAGAIHRKLIALPQLSAHVSVSQR